MEKNLNEKILSYKKKIDEYFYECDLINDASIVGKTGKPPEKNDKTVKKPYTVSGLLCKLELTRREFDKLSAKPRFAKLFSCALSKIEAYIEEHALVGDISANAAANSLKYNFGWGEKQSMADDSANMPNTIKIILDGEANHLAE